MSAPITSARLARELERFDLGEVVLVHTSLSAIAGRGGLVVGGEIAVIDALARMERTVVMPAFSADYSDPAAWTNAPVPAAWWAEIREAMPGWRADRARTFRLGAVAEAFRTTPGVERSEHPQSSFSALGPRARHVVAPHPLDDPLGPRGPLGRLRALDARVLLIGCGFGACTAFHLAEHETDHPPPRVTSSAPMEQGGARVWVRWSEPAYDASRFSHIGASFVGSGAVETSRIGMASAHTFRLADGVAFATRWMNG